MSSRARRLAYRMILAAVLGSALENAPGQNTSPTRQYEQAANKKAADNLTELDQALKTGDPAKIRTANPLSRIVPIGIHSP